MHFNFMTFFLFISILFLFSFFLCIVLAVLKANGVLKKEGELELMEDGDYDEENLESAENSGDD